MRQARLVWIRRVGWATLGLLLASGVVVLLVSVLGGKSVPQRRAITTVTRVLLPPPPPPPPPPKEPPPPQKQTLVQAAPKLQEARPAPRTPAPPRPTAKPAPAAPPGAPLTAEAGAGPNAYGLGVGNGSGDVIGGGGGGGGGDGAKGYGWYAGVIQSQVQVALRRDDRTRASRYRAAVSVWLNASGHVTRAQIVSFTGDAGLQAAVSEALAGLAVGEAPPDGMPQPVHLRIAAQPG